MGCGASQNAPAPPRKERAVEVSDAGLKVGNVSQPLGGGSAPEAGKQRRRSSISALPTPVALTTEGARRGSVVTYVTPADSVPTLQPDSMDEEEDSDEIDYTDGPDPRRLLAKRNSIVAQREFTKRNSIIALGAATSTYCGSAPSVTAGAATTAEPSVAPAPAAETRAGTEELSTGGFVMYDAANGIKPSLHSSSEDAPLASAPAANTADAGTRFDLRLKSSKIDLAQLESMKSKREISVELTAAIGGSAESKRMAQQAAAQQASIFENVLGTYTCRGMEDGKLKPNQDYACYSQPFADVPGTSLFLVCDGHGLHGDAVSQEVLNSLLFELEEQSDELRRDPGHTIAEAFVAVNEHLRAIVSEPVVEVDAFGSGACAVLAYIGGSSLWVGGAGDCRAILGSDADANGSSVVTNPLSVDHAVDHPIEQARLEAAGGYVREAMLDEDGSTFPAKLYSNAACNTGPGLSVSRALGDLNASHLGILPHPHLTYHRLTNDDRYLVLATDGVWTFLESEEVMEMVHKVHTLGKPAQDACKMIIARAARQWARHEGASYRDDITVIVVYVRELMCHLGSERASAETVGRETAQG